MSRAGCEIQFHRFLIILIYGLRPSLSRKSVVRLTDHLDLTIIDDWNAIEQNICKKVNRKVQEEPQTEVAANPR